MKPALLLMLFCSACATRETVRVEFKTLPPKIIEKIYIVIPEPPKMPERLKPKPAESYA
jgi:hypothetical protein